MWVCCLKAVWPKIISCIQLQVYNFKLVHKWVCIVLRLLVRWLYDKYPSIFPCLGLIMRVGPAVPSRNYTHIVTSGYLCEQGLRHFLLCPHPGWFLSILYQCKRFMCPTCLKVIVGLPMSKRYFFCPTEKF